jgi:raffinose/stachyose/melibiose transport system permease protein
MATATKVGPAVTAGPTPAGATKKPLASKIRKRLEIGLFTGPALIVYVSLVMLPVLLAAVYSVFRWDGLGPLNDPDCLAAYEAAGAQGPNYCNRFVGVDNYVRALTDPIFLGAIGHNFFIVALSLLIQGPLAIGLALLLNRKMRGRTLLRLLIFVPYVLSEVVAGLAWKLLLIPNAGFDTFLSFFGWEGDKPNWLEPDMVMWTMFGILTWKYIGFAVILMLAGLQGVPEELSEAAQIDGASWWQTQRHITIPLLGPTIRIWAFLSIVGALQLFDMVWITTKGGPNFASATMATYLVEIGTTRQQIGYGTAVAVILFVISLIIALLYQRFALRRDLEGASTGTGRGR